MTIGISKETLEDWEQSGYEPSMNTLLNECTELNLWLPIDENTPKDRELLLFWRINKHKDIGYFNFTCGQHEQPTHYQELPAEPK